MKSTTARQQAILQFVISRIKEEGLPPTLAEIATAFGFNQVHAAQKHLLALAHKGYLELLPGKARGIRLSPKAVDSTGENLWLPIYGRVAAGPPRGAATEEEAPQVLVDRALFKRTPHYLLKVTGDSMRDEGILEGDLIAVQRTTHADDGQIVVARIDDEITVKRLCRRTDRIVLLPGNPDYAPIEIRPIDSFAIEGIYCGLVRQA